MVTSDGSTPQISRAYWAMVRSLENFPEAAMLRITILVHSVGFWGEGRGGGVHKSSSSPKVKEEQLCYLVELADSLLTPDVVFKICKYLKPETDDAEAPRV